MDGRNGILDLFAQRMGWLKQRHEVLARNVANADTPGYVPRDLGEGTFARTLRGVQASAVTAKTDAGHLPGTLESGRGSAARPSRASYEAAPSGNAVVIEEQLIKATETQMEHSLVTNLYGKYTRMIRTALGAGGGG